MIINNKNMKLLTVKFPITLTSLSEAFPVLYKIVNNIAHYFFFSY